MDKSPRLCGQDWQVWATKLLHCRYPAGDYQEVPDTDTGDAGIEGFSMPDGRVYQMYGLESELIPSQQHKKLRKKMTDDIRKFINNQDKLGRLLGSLKVKRWILFVPSFSSRRIIEHATKKTEDVLQANLPYVDAADFRVVVLQRDAFAAEDEHLLRNAVGSIVVDAVAISAEDVRAWSDDASNREWIGKLEEKTSRLPRLKTQDARASFRNEVVKWWLDGQNVLEYLRNYPNAWESIRRVKSEQEKYLKGHGMLSDAKPSKILMGALDKITTAVGREVKAISAGSRDAVSHEAVADWLMRCPLDFPEVEDDE